MTTQEHRDEVLRALGYAWAKLPHLRLGQLIVSATGDRLVYYLFDENLVDGVTGYATDFDEDPA